MYGPAEILAALKQMPAKDLQRLLAKLTAGTAIFGAGAGAEYLYDEYAPQPQLEEPPVEENSFFGGMGGMGDLYDDGMDYLGEMFGGGDAHAEAEAMLNAEKMASVDYDMLMKLAAYKESTLPLKGFTKKNPNMTAAKPVSKPVATVAANDTVDKLKKMNALEYDVLLKEATLEYNLLKDAGFATRLLSGAGRYKKLLQKAEGAAAKGTGENAAKHANIFNKELYKTVGTQAGVAGGALTGAGAIGYAAAPDAPAEKEINTQTILEHYKKKMFATAELDILQKEASAEYDALKAAFLAKK